MQERIDKKHEGHRLVFHPLIYQWNESRQELSGQLMFTNILPNTTNHVIRLRSVALHGDFKGPGLFGRFGIVDNFGFEEWQRLVHPGETVVYNYTMPPPEILVREDAGLSEQITELHLRVDTEYWYSDDALRTETNPDGIYRFYPDYINFCIEVADGRAFQKAPGRKECNPWARDPTYTASLDDRLGLYPPVEVWAEWTDASPTPLSAYPALRPIAEFLRGFDVSTANLTYKGDLNP